MKKLLFCMLALNLPGIAFSANTEMNEEEGSCYYQNVYIHIKRLDRGYLLINEKGGMTFIISKRGEPLGICNL